jgi:hypothetical protein
VPSKKIQSQATKTRETLRADSLSKAIDAVGQAEFLPRLLDYLRIDVPFVGILLLLLDEHNRPFHIYDTIRTPYRILSTRPALHAFLQTQENRRAADSRRRTRPF